MRHSDFDIQGPMDDDRPEVAWPETPEERIDRFGFRTALLVLVLALFIAAMSPVQARLRGRHPGDTRLRLPAKCGTDC